MITVRRSLQTTLQSTQELLLLLCFSLPAIETIVVQGPKLNFVVALMQQNEMIIYFTDANFVDLIFRERRLRFENVTENKKELYFRFGKEGAQATAPPCLTYAIGLPFLSLSHTLSLSLSLDYTPSNTLIRTGILTHAFVTCYQLKGFVN